MAVIRAFFTLLTKGITFLLVLTTITAYAKEGMWIPATLTAHEREMRAMGLELPVDLIYNNNGTAMNNAIVLFGKGCTGELVSGQGLILTNHHCGYGSVQALSGPERDYFANGYFAKSTTEELPCPGLTVTFIRRMENVTGQVLNGIPDTLNDVQRDSIISIRELKVEREFAKATGMDALIKPYFEGNQYWVAIMETYNDIRLAAFPPNGIGAFGGDVENWMWPRHTGDFSVFRVYAGADNKPATYAAGNKPYHTSEFLNISIGGYKEGDFTMVYGFPGTTREYISSAELRQVYSITDPISIEARTIKLAVWSKHMAQSRDLFIKYTAKRAGIANGWKKWQGEVQGLKVNDAIGKKRAAEKKFQQWAGLHNDQAHAGSLLAEMSKAAHAADTLLYEEQYDKETVMAIELIQQAAATEKLQALFRLHLTDSTLRDTLTKSIKGMEWFYKNYDTETDKEVFTKLMPLYFKNCSACLTSYYSNTYNTHDHNFFLWADDVYSHSLFTSIEKLTAFATHATNADSMVLSNDPAWALYSAVATVRKEKLSPRLKEYYSHMHYLNRLYMKEQMAMYEHKAFYPDANLTLRLAYGKVKGLKPDGSGHYGYQTNLDDVIAAGDTAVDIFKVPTKLKDLYHKKDYGRWGVKGNMPVAFIADNHTSGGNSGSPVLNAKGELIGTNFDRAYEGTMSDYYFDPKRCRNISVDMRYTLFIIDKFGGASWLMDEMNIVK